MRSRLPRHRPLGVIACGVLAFALAGLSVRAEDGSYPGRPTQTCPPPACPTPAMPLMPGPVSPPEVIAPPGTAMTPPSTVVPPTAAAPADLFASGRAFAGASETIARDPSGYIDNAIPMTQFRLRYDDAYGDNRPDRAEFFYAKCGCFGGRAPGPPLGETSVDYQDISAYLEAAWNNRFSGFVEVPVRFLNPERNKDTTGIGDMNAGFKWAVVGCAERYLTFQLRTYIPTGDAFRGLGTRHVSLEPALLAYQRWGERLSAFGELRDWIPINGTDFAGNVLRYGVGLGYDVYRCQNLCVTPVAEFVGWTVLGGKEFLFPEGVTKDASGDTIVNVKLGGRVDFGEHSSFYVGYGRALTGTVWYKDILRVEYRLAF
jgi:hypothetical protein